MQMFFDQATQPQRVEAGHIGADVDLAMGFQITTLVIQRFQCLVFFRDGFQCHHGQVAALLEIAVFVEYVGDTTAHARRKVAPGFAEHHHHTTGHVLAAVVADAFNHCAGTGVADCKAFAADTAEVTFTGYGAVQNRVADYDILFCNNRAVPGRVDHQAAAGQALADVVVAFAFQFQGDPVRDPGAEALSGNTVEFDVNGVFRESFQPVAFGNTSGKHGADSTIAVHDRGFDLHRLTALQCRPGLFDQLVIQCLVEAVVLFFAVENGDVRAGLRLVQDARVVQAPGFPVVNAFTHIQFVGAADHFVHRAEAQFRHQLTNFFRYEEEIVHHVLGFAGKTLAQFFVLGGDTDRAGIQMTLAHHDATFDDQGRSCEAKLIGTQQCADNDITAGTHTTVDLHGNSATQFVQHQGLVCFGQAKLPRTAGVADGSQWRCAGAAIVTGDGDVIGVCLGDTCSNGTYTHFGYQLDADTCFGVHVLQVVDQLCQILDGIDVVMRRRRDETDTRCGMADFRNPVVHLVTGQLAAFAGLGALRHLDLDVVRVHQVFGGHAEAARGYLFDSRAHGVTVVHGLEARAFFATLTGIGLAAQAVHGDGQRGVCFPGNRSEGHGSGGKALDNIRGGFDLVEWYRILAEFQFEQAAQGAQVFILFIHQH